MARAIDQRETEGRGSLYRMLWRWHFYAGLICIPFVIWLAVTGSIYLFRPQIDAWIDRDVAVLQRTGEAASQADLVAAATAAVPGSTFAAIMLPEQADQAARVAGVRQGRPHARLPASGFRRSPEDGWTKAPPGIAGSSSCTAN